MRDQITVRFYISGGVDGTITKESVMSAYNYFIKTNRADETEDELCEDILRWVEGDAYLDTNCDIDECELCDFYKDEVLSFIKECIKSDGVHEDEEGQTHLFDPTDYEISEWELEQLRRKR